jgi:hypothetical protein
MNRTRLLLFGSVIVAALFFGGVVGSAAARGTFSAGPSVFAAISAASPSPSSNEATTHEAGESAAQETAENNGTARPGGPGGHPCGGPGHSNETSTHETGESASIEASENAACPAGTATPATTPTK